jgi:hypothetical protein
MLLIALYCFDTVKLIVNKLRAFVGKSGIRYGVAAMGCADVGGTG